MRVATRSCLVPAMSIDWNDLRFLLNLARTGSLTRSASAMQVSVSTMSRRLEALEAALGSTLFTRHSTGVLLTDHGRDLVLHAERVEAEIVSLERSAAGRDSQLTGTVRLATADTLASHILIPALGGFRDRYPEIELELVTGIGAIGLSRREADLALRLVEPKGRDLICRKLVRQANALYASAGYLEKRPWNGKRRFEDHLLIGWDESLSHLPLAQWLRDASHGARVGLRLTNLPAHLAAARAGAGLAVLPCFLGDVCVDLTRLLGPDDVFTEDLWLILHPDLANSARVRAIADFVTATVTAARDRFEGRRAI